MTTPHNAPLSEVEGIKENSNYLRGTIRESLADPITGGLAPADVNLIKFHGSYQQHDRALEAERKKQKLEPLYSFMIRVRLAGGISTAQQWIEMDRLADKYATGTIKLTTRQAFQFHGILKRNLKKTIQEINDSLLDTIAACGDVNRNVMCNPNPAQSPVQAEVYAAAKAINDHLTPNTSAYHEIWLDKNLVAGGEPDSEPIYGKTYLPRKFKIAIAIPPNNDSDIFANDLGLIAIVENNELIGYNIAIGGGMGMTFGSSNTYPRLGNVIGFCPKDQIIELAEKVVTVQRDLGNRSDRKVSRFKYTIDRLGLDVVTAEINARLSNKLQSAKPYQFTSNGDEYGWKRAHDNRWSLTLFVEGGRVVDTPELPLRTVLRQIAELTDGDFRLTGNQNLILANVSEPVKKKIDSLISQHKILPNKTFTGLRQSSLACVALNTCTLAFAEAERYLPSLIDKLDQIVIANNIEKEPIVVRMTGCPNGCARPYLGEIGFVGKAPGRYNLYLGAGFSGDRLNKLYKENLNEQEILETLKPIFADYAQNRNTGERFGNFVIRRNYVAATTEGLTFHS